MIKDQEKEYVMRFLSDMLNSEYDLETVDYKAYHVPYTDIPRKYGRYKIKTFFFFYRLDCLYEKGLITESIKNQLLELYNYYKELDNQLESYVMKANNIRRDIEDMEYKGIKISEEKLRSLKNEIEVEENSAHTIIKKMKEVEEIFNNYHLLEEINLGQLIENSVRVDDENYDLNGEIEKIRNK